MAQQYRCRPSSLVGVTDPYAAYCLDEAIYLFGNYVEAELRRVSDKAKNAKAAQRERAHMLATLLRDSDELMTVDSLKRPISTNHNVATLDKDDPVSPETAARMPPAVKFTGRKFKDPAELFKNKKTT